MFTNIFKLFFCSVCICLCTCTCPVCVCVCVCVREQEVVERFVSQGHTQKHLEKLKEENERMLVQLKEERDQLQANFQELKYSGEAKLSRCKSLCVCLC